MNIVIVGAGGIGCKRARALDHSDKVIGVVDVDSDRAGKLGKQLGCPTSISFGDLAIENPGETAVIVATTHNFLVPVAQQALNIGCHVLIEKPGARSAAELESLKSVNFAGQTIAVGYNHRFHPGIMKLKEAAVQKKFGSIISIRARYGHGGRPGYETEWRANREISGGGELLDQGSHLLDLTSFIGGKFEIEHSRLDKLWWDMPVEDNVWMLGSNESGAAISLHASWTEWKNNFSFEVFFETAKVEVNGLGGSYGPETYVESFMDKGFGPPTVTSVQYPPEDTSWELEWADFKSEIFNRSTGTGARLPDALEVLKIADRIYRDANY